MIDLHCHLLPNMDDGSESVEQTRAMLDKLAQQGVTAVAATSHFYGDRETPASFLRRRGEALAQIQASPTHPKIIPGAEVAFFSGISTCEEIIPMQLGQTGLILVEMPFCAWSDRIVDEILLMKERLGLTPVLAHIDRYRNKKQFPKYYETFLEHDVYFQCNTPVFSKPWERHWALNLVKKGHIHFLGTDAHNTTTRPPEILAATQIMEKKLGANAVKQFHLKASQLLFSECL